MKPLLSAAGAQRLDAIIRPGVLCVFDFDGTLAPIVARPDDACMAPAVREQLVQLQQHARVAILTGRALADIRERLRFDADFVIGNHGLEGLPSLPGHEEEDTASETDRHASLCRAWRAALAPVLADTRRFDTGILLEDKTISLSVHYRQAIDPALAQAALLQLFTTLMPAPRIVTGKYVFNLLPPAAGNKGTAIERLMRVTGAPSVLYVGDDVTDEDVFRLTRRDLLSLRVGHSIHSAAEFFLPQHVDILRLLDVLIARLARSPAPLPKES